LSGYLEGVLVLLAINVISAYAAFLPIAAGQLNLGVAGFMAIGAYLSAYLTNELGVAVLPAILAASALTGLVALAIAAPVLRTRGIYLALATFAVGQIVEASILNLRVVGGAAGYPVAQYVGLPTIAGFALGVFAVVFVLFRMRFGLCITAVHDDEAVADLLGVNVRAYQTAAFALGSAIAAIAGGLYAHHYSYVEAQSFNVMLSIYIVLYVLLGGTQTIYGPLAGALVFTLLPELLRVGAEWRYVAFAAILIVVMAVRPQGLLTAAPLRRLLAPRRAAP
jgi:branched-chain amino acid transport system permease protein